MIGYHPGDLFEVSPSTPQQDLLTASGPGSPPVTPSVNAFNHMTMEVESMRMVSQDLSPSSRMPLMPLMDFEVTDMNAPPKLFLATPDEIFKERGMGYVDSQKERLAQFRSLAQGTSSLQRIQKPCMVHFPKCQGGSPTTPAFAMRTPLSAIQSFRGSNKDDADDMSDDEVAIASGRSLRYSQGPQASKFKLRPKTLSREDAWDPDFLFRS